MSDLHSLALKSGAATWQEPGAHKLTYLMSIEELRLFLALFFAEQERQCIGQGRLQ